MTQQEWVDGMRTICIDFNGVIDTYKGWTGNATSYPMRPDAELFLKTLVDKGYRIVIFTAANIPQVKQWITRNGLDKYIDDVTNIKVPALCYVDDRAVQFKGNFFDTLSVILDFKTYWEDSDHQEGGKV